MNQLIKKLIKMHPKLKTDIINNFLLNFFKSFGFFKQKFENLLDKEKKNLIENILF